MHIQVITRMHLILFLSLYRNLAEAPRFSLASRAPRRCNVCSTKETWERFNGKLPTWEMFYRSIHMGFCYEG